MAVRPIELRSLADADDVRWILKRHQELYARELGWDASFSELVRAVLRDFTRTADPRREHGWIAMQGGRRVGSVVCADAGAGTARLRTLLVEPRVRGQGLGTRLVGTCVEFARGAGYARIELWTTDDLEAARRIYARAGFERRGAYREERFGTRIVSEDWVLELI